MPPLHLANSERFLIRASQNEARPQVMSSFRQDLRSSLASKDYVITVGGSSTWTVPREAVGIETASFVFSQESVLTKKKIPMKSRRGAYYELI